MGLSNFPSPGDGGLFPVLLMNTVISLTIVRNVLRSALQFLGILTASPSTENADAEFEFPTSDDYDFIGKKRRVTSVTRFDVLFRSATWNSGEEECSVCLCGFEGEAEVSLLPCNHFFHRNCLEKWFLSLRSTCPLCRSLL